MFGEVGGGGEEGIKFGVDYFYDFWGESFGEGGDDVLEAEDLFVGCWVGGEEGAGCYERTESQKVFSCKVVSQDFRPVHASKVLTSADEDFEAHLLRLNVLWAEFEESVDELHGFCQGLRSLQ